MEVLNNKVKNENYYVIQGWMINELNLKGNELHIYAIIYGFSQSHDQEFNGSISYLGHWIRGNRQTVINILKKLVEKKLLIKKEKLINNIKNVSYVATTYSDNYKRKFIGGSLKNRLVVENLDYSTIKINIRKLENMLQDSGSLKNRLVVENLDTIYTNTNLLDNIYQEKEINKEKEIKHQENIYEYIEKNFGRTLNPIEYEKISQWEDSELTRYAIDQTVLKNIYNLTYIQRILDNYSKNNIKTVGQAQEQERNFKNKIENKSEVTYERVQ